MTILIEEFIIVIELTPAIAQQSLVCNIGRQKPSYIAYILHYKILLL
ncbi:hypothetical protein [Thermoanaerobacter sp. A7A]|nr:hypothetical protein [Thermoanaerobacter sp. A7A]